MTKCVSEEIRDALPEFAHGQLDADRVAEVRSHIVTCADCAAELALLQLLVDSVPAAPRMDVDRIVNALPLPTRHGFLLHRGNGRATETPASAHVVDGAAHRPLWNRPVVRIAAGVAIVAAGGLSLLVGRDVLRPDVQVGQRVANVRSITPLAVSTEPAAVPIVEPPQTVTSESSAAPREIASASAAGLSLGGELDEIPDAQLATLLSDIDQMDAMPAAEPAPVEPVVSGSMGGDQ